MANRRAIFAARFLRPPGYTKRLLLREKPRELTGPYENPVRRWVRLREKARQFSELPPPRRTPVPKPNTRKPLQKVEGVPKVSPEALQARLDFLLSPGAVEQQLQAPLLPGRTPYEVEFLCWERQMRDLRRIYRAQYLQKLAEVTELEMQKEEELHQKVIAERKERKKAHLQRVGEDMKRRAILADRQRIESKVDEAILMARRSKIKRRQIYWYRRIETLSKLVVSKENFEKALPAPTAAQKAGGTTESSSIGHLPASGVLLSRNVSVPFLLRQLGGAKSHPQQKSRRMPHVDNVQRELQELSYDILPEDEPRFEPAPSDAPSHRQRAVQEYSVFSEEEKRKLLDMKIAMLEEKLRFSDEKGELDPIATRLYDELTTVKKALEEGDLKVQHQQAARAERGEDIIPPPKPTDDRAARLASGAESTLETGAGRAPPGRGAGGAGAGAGAGSDA